MSTPVEIPASSAWLKLQPRRLLNQLLCLLIAYLAFGYNINACLSALVNDNSGLINIAARAILLGGSLFFFGYALLLRQIRISVFALPFLLFLAYYSLRLLYDIEVKGVVFARESFFKFYSLYLGNIVIPALAVILCARYIRVLNLVRYVYFITAVSNLFIFLYLVDEFGLSQNLFLTRASLSIESATGEKRHVINAISLAFNGEVLSLMTICRLLLGGSRLPRLMHFLLLLLGLINLALGASRGPLGSFVLLAFCVLLFNFYVRRKTVFFLLKQLLFAGWVVAIIAGIIFYGLRNNLSFVTRVFETVDRISSGEKEVRSYQWESAWDQFKAAPALGDQYLERYANFYPHNVYLEVLMATGILGGTLFLIGLGGVFLKFFKMTRWEQLSIFPLFLMVLAILLANITSGSLFGSVPFWILLFTFSAVQTNRFVAEPATGRQYDLTA